MLQNIAIIKQNMEHGVTQVVEILTNLKSVGGLYKEVFTVTEMEEKDL